MVICFSCTLLDTVFGTQVWKQDRFWINAQCHLIKFYERAWKIVQWTECLSGMWLTQLQSPASHSVFQGISRNVQWAQIKSNPWTGPGAPPLHIYNYLFISCLQSGMGGYINHFPIRVPSFTIWTKMNLILRGKFGGERESYCWHNWKVFQFYVMWDASNLI